MKKQLILFVFFFGIVFNVLAQRGNGKINGSVKNINQKELQSASIVLLKPKDSSSVKFTVADKAGNFEFTGIANGKYLVGLSSVGYAKTFSPLFEITDARPEITLDAIMMAESAKGLAGVTVTAKKPFVEQKIDRMVVNVEASVTNLG